MNTEVETHKAQGQHQRQDISLIELAAMFPTEEAATEWFESVVWADGRVCGHCDSDDTYEVKSGKPMPYRCRTCKRYFGIKTGTVMARSSLSLRQWVYAIYLNCASLRGISAMALHRSIDVTYKTAWFMQQRVREAFAAEGPPVPFDASAYRGHANHEAVHHSVSEYVREKAHTNDVESFWAALKCGIEASFSHISPKHAQRYVDEFCWRHNIRDQDTINQMRDLVARMVGRRITHRELVA